MKVSKYTFFVELMPEAEFYLYNTLSNALMEVDGNSFALLMAAQEGRHDVTAGDYDPELYDALSRRTMITESDKDDFLKFKATIMRMRGQRTSMHLTLAPTMDCCFRCHYCFEKYKAKAHMTDETMEAIVKYVMSCRELKTLHLTWFGGEPLMAVREIEMFYDRLAPRLGDIKFTSNIITTGYHIDEEAVRILEKAQVKSVQITLDGMRETHNRVKNLGNGEDVFGRVLDNIELYNRLAPDVNIVIRVNLTHENEREYIPLYRMLTERFKGKPMIAPAPAFVMDRGTAGGEIDRRTLFSHGERSRFILGLADMGIHSPFVRYPKRFFYECAIRNDMAIAFDAEGYAYKCWEVIGNKDYAVGRLDADGVIKDINGRVLNRQLYGADPFEDAVCRECRYMPLCCGGCPIQRIENEFEEGRNVCCSHYKGHIEEFIKRHIRMRKKGLDNR